MTSVVSLPKTPSQLPGDLSTSELLTDTDASLFLAQECLYRITKPTLVAGSIETPLNWWLAAQIVFPDVEKLLFQADGHWLKITPNDIQKIRNETSKNSLGSVGNQQPEPTTNTIAAPPNREPTLKSVKAEMAPASSKKDTIDLAWETYKAFAWNDGNAESLYQRYLRQAGSEYPADPGLILRIEKLARQGRRAAELANTLKKKISQGESADDVRAWINILSSSEPNRVITTLRKTLKDDSDFSTNKRALRSINQRFKIELPYTQVDEDRHPQSLRELRPSKRWEIYIDETGKNFSEQAQSLNETDKDLGRIVALAMPAGHGLPELPSETHAKNLPNSDIQELLLTLTTSTIGVLGATLKADIKSQSWIAAVTKMVRWTLLMLPITGPTQVIVKIEQRKLYQDSATLLALEETLVDELAQLAPERFKNIELSLEFMTKEDPFNGYVDVIANCWGSPDRTKKDLLKRTRWLGHCLIQTESLAEIDRLYQEADDNMDSSAWFKICAALAKEPGHSLFHDLLTQLGRRTQSDTALWQKYLGEVRHRIALKQFDAGSLNRALEWLSLYRPATEQLPGLLDLQLKSAQLAATNHMGHCDVNQVAQVMKLAHELMDESAPDACEAALRVAISATNGFDFTSVVPYVESWASQPIAVPGRLNHGKLLSTLGQLCAFREEQEQALHYFDKALEQFGQLSDPMQASRNQQQTSIYKAIVQLDLKLPDAAEAVKTLADKLTGKTGVLSIRRLARSSSPLRFGHYLLLRWLTHNPEETQLREEYLERIDEWQFGEGHPWMLINAYRAWLLADSERADEAASYLQKAIDECEEAESNAILNWMAHCLHALGGSLGLVLDQPARKCPTAPFPAEELVKLRKANSTGERVTALNTLLPFNFH
jgi:tetratricopeptide (TPR) repeat protein